MGALFCVFFPFWPLEGQQQTRVWPNEVGKTFLPALRLTGPPPHCGCRELSPDLGFLGLNRAERAALTSVSLLGFPQAAAHLAYWPNLLFSVQPGNSVLLGVGLDLSLARYLDPYPAWPASSGKSSVPCQPPARRPLEQVPTSISP